MSMRTIRRGKKTSEDIFNVDLRHYVCNLEASEKLWLYPVVFPMFVLLKKKWPDVRVSIVDTILNDQYPRFWFIVHAFDNTGPCRIPTREKWTGDYTDIIFSAPVDSTPVLIQTLVARFELLLVLWTILNLMGGLSACGDVTGRFFSRLNAAGKAVPFASTTLMTSTP